MLDLDFWRTTGLGLAVLGQFGFIMLYATFPWWRTFLGKALFFKAIALGAICLVAFLSRLGVLAYESEVFTAMYWLLAVGVWAQFLAFMCTKYLAQKEDLR